MLKKIFFISMAVALSFSFLINCNKKELKPYDVKFEKETIDLGTVVGGTTVKAVFKFKNTGTETIEIKVVRPTCGCIAPGDWDQTTTPGKTGKIPISYNTEAFEGEVTKVTFVDTNIPGRESIPLFLTANVYNPVQIFTKTCWLGNIAKENEPLHGSYLIAYHLDTPLEVSEIVLPENTSANMVTVEPLKQYRLDFTVYPPFERYEITHKKIILKIGGKVNRDFELVYSYLVPPPIQVNPRIVKLDMKKLKREKIERRINIKSNIDDPIEIQDLKFDGTGVDYSITALREHMFLQIPLVFPVGFTFPEDKQIFHLTFRVKNDPRGLLYTITIQEDKK